MKADNVNGSFVKAMPGPCRGGWTGRVHSSRVVVSLVSGALLAGLVAFGASGCGGSSKRMGEREALSYKYQLLTAHKSELSPAEANKLLYFPGRTRAEIDAYVDQLREEYAATVAAERALMDAGSRQDTLPAPTPAGTPAPPSGAGAGGK